MNGQEVTRVHEYEQEVDLDAWKRRVNAVDKALHEVCEDAHCSTHHHPAEHGQVTHHLPGNPFRRHVRLSSH